MLRSTARVFSFVLIVPGQVLPQQATCAVSTAAPIISTTTTTVATTVSTSSAQTIPTSSSSSSQAVTAPSSSQDTAKSWLEKRLEQLEQKKERATTYLNLVRNKQLDRQFRLQEIEYQLTQFHPLSPDAGKLRCQASLIRSELKNLGHKQFENMKAIGDAEGSIRQLLYQPRDLHRSGICKLYFSIISRNFS